MGGAGGALQQSARSVLHLLMHSSACKTSDRWCCSPASPCPARPNAGHATPDTGLGPQQYDCACAWADRSYIAGANRKSAAVRTFPCTPSYLHCLASFLYWCASSRPEPVKPRSPGPRSPRAHPEPGKPQGGARRSLGSSKGHPSTWPRTAPPERARMPAPEIGRGVRTGAAVQAGPTTCAAENRRRRLRRPHGPHTAIDWWCTCHYPCLPSRAAVAGRVTQ